MARGQCAGRILTSAPSCVMCVRLQSCAAMLRNSPWQRRPFPYMGIPADVTRHVTAYLLPATIQMTECYAQLYTALQLILF